MLKFQEFETLAIT